MAQHRIYSCDDHLDMNAVPPTLWTDRTPAATHETIPHVVEKNGMRLWIVDGTPVSISGRYAGIDSAIDRAGVEDDGFRPSTPDLRVQDMERDGIWASVVYGPTALFRHPLKDRALIEMCVRAWNDWAAAEFNAYAPDRLFALPDLPTTSAEAAATELERCIQLGHRGAMMNGFDVDLADRQWDRLWAFAAEAGTPISFHIGGGTRIDPRKRGWHIAGFAAIAPMQMDEILSILVFAGILERHPSLKVVLAESGVGWVPYMVARMDATFEKHCVPHPEYSIKTKPSELFARQVWATFEEEPLGPQLIPLLSPDNFMWACDYPHPDSTWPHSREAIDHALGHLGPAAVEKITGGNCKALYRLP
jgi:predicted TIM-barrel fold metal-dependent hydrolase